MNTVTPLYEKGVYQFPCTDDQWGHIEFSTIEEETHALVVALRRSRAPRHVTGMAAPTRGSIDAWTLHSKLLREAQDLGLRVTCYHPKTPQVVRDVLENAISTGNTIRLFYGDDESGKDWCMEQAALGTVVERKRGFLFKPMIRSNGDGVARPIETHWIIKIQDALTGEVLYEHHSYHQDEIEVREEHFTVDRLYFGKTTYTHRVYVGGRPHAHHTSRESAEAHAEFLRGDSRGTIWQRCE